MENTKGDVEFGGKVGVVVVVSVDWVVSAGSSATVSVVAVADWARHG